tara:strand:- start:1806 stop:3425 length:1620 start_codon:yes stop_codon:yes gene_type:complete
MTSPDSFCFISTYNSSHELVGMLLSLSIYHNKSKVYGLVDTETYNLITTFVPKIQLQMFLKISLNKYSNKDRTVMVRENIWDEFQMQKANVIKYALENEKDTMFLDSDILFLNPLSYLDKSKDLCLSPHYVRKSNTDEVGYYNGGCLWVKNKNVPDDWIKFTKTSRYHDQASIEDLARVYSYQEFGKEVNFMPWRVLLADDQNEVINSININNNNININDKPLIFLHTHFDDQRFIQINNIFINILRKLKRYKELLIIDRIIYKKWIIKIPKQPQQGIWRHANDSFRELALLYKKNNENVDIELTDGCHCMIGNHILLYDRPTLEWFNQDLLNTSLVLLGNGDINKEGKILNENNVNVKPWIFWPRRPFIIEKFLNNKKIKSYNERIIESIFIGNIENSVQNVYRNSENNWKDVIDLYYCTHGTQHKFSQEEYLEKLANSKYGLCLRGYGSKCHREVELMALGVVPIITSEVSIKSYMEPPKENIHYIVCKNPDNLKNILSNISQDKWEKLSKNCYDWYKQNVYSKNSLKMFLTKIFYN